MSYQGFDRLARHNLSENAEQHLTGQRILDRQDDPAVRMVGRRGGVFGVLFTQDVKTEAWRGHRYEVSGAEAKLAGNPNWLTLKEFVTAVKPG